MFISFSHLITVLIDTWWNVNPARGIKLLNGINRFNRYMVECEFKPEAISDSGSPSFNRYMVECEFYSLLKAFEPPQSFNRYMVECECS